MNQEAVDKRIADSMSIDFLMLHPFGRRAAIFCASASLAMIPASVFAAGWPKLDGSGGKQCDAALRIGKVMFNGPEAYIGFPHEIPPDLSKQLVLKPGGLDLSGGDARRVSPTNWLPMA